MKKEIEAKFREALQFASDNCPTPGRIRITMGRGKAIALLWVDSTNPSIADSLKVLKDANPAIAEAIEKLKAERQEAAKQWASNPIEADLRMDRIESEMLELLNLQRQEHEPTPNERVWTVLAMVGHALEKIYADESALKSYTSAIKRLSRSVMEGDRDGGN